MNQIAIVEFLQRELSKRNLSSVSAVEAATWLDGAGILKDSKDRPGKPLRDLLRAGRIAGQRQEPNGRWHIDRILGGRQVHNVSNRAISSRENKGPHAQAGITDTTTYTTASAALARFAAARAKYKPRSVRYILLAESPPRADSGRFFYFEDVSEKDTLFWETMKTLYPDECPPTGYPRHRKREFLERFQADGFYLLDAVEEPLGAKGKQKRIQEALPKLLQNLKAECKPNTRVVLISAPVYEVCATPLKTAGFNIINTEMIDFPGSGGQRKFREKLARLLKSSSVGC